jgi:hypothetical protein
MPATHGLVKAVSRPQFGEFLKELAEGEELTSNLLCVA